MNLLGNDAHHYTAMRGGLPGSEAISVMLATQPSGHGSDVVSSAKLCLLQKTLGYRQLLVGRIGLGLMNLAVLRGTSKVTAGLTGLLLVYGIVYAMEGMTTRIPMSRLHELVITTLWMLPWTLLFCSGFEDLSSVRRQAWLLWVGMTLVLGFLYYFERNTTSSLLTKAAMPLMATGAGLLPHAIPRIRFIFSVCCLATGIAGIVVLSFALSTYFSAGHAFATEGITLVIFVFGTASLTTGVLSVASFRKARLR